MKRLFVVIAVFGAMLAAAGIAAASGVTASLSGGAVAGSSSVSLTSDLTDTNTANDSSSIVFAMPAGTTFADLKTLSAQFNPTVGGCGGGSPRFSIELASGRNVFVYFGPSPSFTGCTLNSWQSTGNLIGNNDTGRYDTSQVQGGTQVSTYAAALALIGSQQVTKIDLVVDAGWFFKPQVQTVLVRDVQINNQTFFATPSGKTTSAAQQCKAELASIGRKAFEAKYGSNHNHKNAMGKCVSAKAHTHASTRNSHTRHHR
jgi:hypothetical protein